jgi:MipA family protein
MTKRAVAYCLFAAWIAAAGAAEPAPPPPGELPLWEIGLFGFGARLPDYRGSDEYTFYAFPTPFLIYRGQIFRSNREGFKGVFWENDRFETGLSFGGNPPVDDDNRARRGMPEIGAIGEFGPMIKAYFTGRRNPNPFYALAAARMVVSLDTDDFDLRHRGYRGELKLTYLDHTSLEKHDVNFGFNLGVDFGDRDCHRYFYEVEPRFATVDRPAYVAHGGYGGLYVSTYATRKLNRRLWASVYYRWDNVAGAAYADSPLVKTENNHVVGFALIWDIARSKRTSPYLVEISR